MGAPDAHDDAAHPGADAATPPTDLDPAEEQPATEAVTPLHPNRRPQRHASSTKRSPKKSVPPRRPTKPRNPRPRQSRRPDRRRATGRRPRGVQYRPSWKTPKKYRRRRYLRLQRFPQSHAVADSGWRPLFRPQTRGAGSHAFHGGAVLMTGLLGLLLRRHGPDRRKMQSAYMVKPRPLGKSKTDVRQSCSNRPTSPSAPRHRPRSGADVTGRATLRGGARPTLPTSGRRHGCPCSSGDGEEVEARAALLGAAAPTGSDNRVWRRLGGTGGALAVDC